MVAPLSIAVGFIFYRWNIPAAWILAAILCAGGCALLTGRELAVHSEVEVFAKALIAMITAVPLITTPPRQLALFILPGLMVAAVTLVMSFVGGLVLARASSGEITQETAILSLLAGGASIMPPLAQELGADYRYVALSQYLRLFTVTITLPLITPLLGLHSQGAVATQPHGAFTWMSWVVMIFITAPAGCGAGGGIRCYWLDGWWWLIDVCPHQLCTSTPHHYCLYCDPPCRVRGNGVATARLA